MMNCRRCCVIWFFWLMVNLVQGLPYSTKTKIKPTRKATNYSVETVTNFPMFRPQIPNIRGNPKCAHNLTFCENIDSYPYTHLKYILGKNSSFKGVFTDEPPKEELVHRNSPDGYFVCRSISRKVFPKIGKNKHNKWKYIVNQDDLLQSVLVEICHNFNGACDVIGDISPGYSTFCRQKYMYSKLLSLNDGGYPVPDIFKIPSACCCAYRRNINFLKEFGAPVTAVRFLK